MRTSINHIREKKTKGEPLVMLTCYDYSTARILDDAGIEILLVGDSLGTVMLGYESTIPVTMDEMIHHTKAVVRGTKKAMIVADMPFMTYQVNEEEALYNAARFIQEAGAGAVKIEGGEHIAPVIKRITGAGIPVMAHLGLTPQYIHALGGYRIQGKNVESAVKMYRDALAVEQAGAFALVLETVPTLVATHITNNLKIPTIGIGAGDGCDGQVQVVHDILGSFTDFKPKHARRYANLAESITQAVTAYRDDVASHDFPGDEESFVMDSDVYEEFKRAVS
ncbi:MAG: 3-methyl-2-oxobutanoate hydroxymethyltransferase [Dehalococcoidales bacterium]|jgi:3-methyl-2-oxobutanoate hydroxymethyltransferase|nr:3-methyl-2-oxobutanoate hydroxymethyltransferase [Dehalococcoidales bacterium]MDD3264975.1 3-methyl-2-oxobutanoate hydroxymethyltransferase [Dehalococcoidales bacterium]MDD4322592.1 3-methyl-2-oxobutanoate hydroxymethyltransferase [Dehalococcoidales bacterium]MDD4794807.1 3-methyl-2-oxobutanoate hydroxymethyltransferase [Dehalococcoidales bacterium]